MNIQTIVIGEYQISPAVSFRLYQVPSPLVTPPLSNNQQQSEYFNFFCLEDLFAIFDLHSIKQDLIQSYQYYPGFYCKDEVDNRSFIQTHVMADIALKHNLYNLVDLCRLDDKELLLGGAIPLLKMTTCLRLQQKPIKSTTVFRPRPLDGNEWFFTSQEEKNVKLEPFSPTLSPPVITVNNSRRRSQQRLSFESTSSSSTSLMSQTIQEEEDTLIRLPKPSSLLLKRLAPKHGHKKNLTILTPSYNNEDPSNSNGIQSAPLRRTTIPPIHHRSGNKNKITKKTSPSSNLSKMVSVPWPQTSIQARFPSPPIVPSQQPAWNQYRKKVQQVNTPALPPLKKQSPSPPSLLLSQKQKFLQPFEYLYDHIEQTRVLKTSLDDQIRRSSSLMQTLQSSSTMVESLVRRQVRDMVDEKFESKLRECTERISRLEYRTTSTSIPISPANSPTSCDNNKDLLLTQLMSRIDQLESKLLSK